MTNNAASPTVTRVGWIGTGVMGAAMCGHLLAKGFPATVSSRTRARADALIRRGARWAGSPREVAAASDVVFTMVGFPADVRAVGLEADGVLAGAAPGTVWVDMTTSEPSLAVEIERAAAAVGVHTLDAPVSGGDVGAREATLSIMVGGEPAVFERVQPLLACLGTTIVHQGPAGSGQHTKMVNQVLVAAGMIGICEALLYAHRAGLDLESVLRSVGGGAAGSRALALYAPRILARQFDPGFLVDHFVKDMGIVLAEAHRMRLALPGLALVEQLYVAMQAQGHGRKGTHALILAVGGLSNVEW